MHPSSATLTAFCDAELAPGRQHRVSRHLAQCEPCRKRLAQIRSEKDRLSAPGEPAPAGRDDLAAVRSAMAAWQEGRNSAAASELKARLRWQLQTYFGSAAALAVERPDIRAEEMLGKASEMLEAFLGPDAAQAVSDDVLGGLDWVAPAQETCQ